MNNASRGYCLSTIRGHIENNLNNFYNKLQRFAGTLPLRGPFKPRVACSETTIYNASPGQSAGNGHGENVLFHGILSRHDHSFRPSIGSVRTKAAAR